MAWVIKDTNGIGEYYRQRASGNGWYSYFIDDVRLFTSPHQAQKTIDAAGHHVTYPGNRNLVVQEVKIVEV